MGATGTALPTSVLRRASQAIDLAVLTRLTWVGVDKPSRIDLRPLDPGDFWAESTVRHPREVWVTDEFTPFEGPEWRELQLAGDSAGPGAHAGASRLVATAHIRRGHRDAPAVLLVHGYAIPFTGFDRWLAWRMRRRGAHTIRIELPFHLRRAVPGRESGAGFFSIDPAHSRAVIRQSVEDCAALVAWAQRNVSPVVSVVGTSLGGLMALLLAAQLPLDGLLAVAPLCDPASSFLLRPPILMQRRMGMLGDGDSFWGRDRDSALEVLRQALAPLTPAAMQPATPASRMTFVIPESDRIVGADPMERLAGAWGPEVWRYPHGHITVMNAPGLASRIVARAVQPPVVTGEISLAG